MFARWTDSHFYPGRVRSTQTTSLGSVRHMISFDDGTVLDVPAADLFLSEIVSANYDVMANRGGFQERAQIIEVYCFYAYCCYRCLYMFLK